MEYNQSGNYITLAGFAVTILAKFGIVSDVASIATVIGSIVIVVGIVKQYLAHKKLAITAGATHA